MYAQSEQQTSQKTETVNDSLNFIQIRTDSIFNSNQIISLLTVQKTDLKKLKVEFGFSKSDLKKTSSFAKSKNALAAINGGFFNIDEGGSVSYFEINDSVISRQRNPELKWGVSDRIINGAIVIVNDSIIKIEQALSEQFYESSNKESAVLVTGPVLLLNSEAMSLPQKKFVTNRHPRTCLCKKKTSLVFITIDGRSKEAEGMNLFEVQKFLLRIGCVDAINLDGGGSTTMWIHDKGVVNFPSDKTGERPVSNVLLLLNK
jgi:exopolysaccharide biosynthesis protein